MPALLAGVGVLAVSAGAFLGLGDSAAAPGQPLPSEYGATERTGYLSVSWFF